MNKSYIQRLNQVFTILNKGENVMKVNWINGFDAGNKKEKYYLEFRVGTFTILEIKWEKSRFRFMLLNLGFEI